tara:strand:+ start:301 stop:3009 length:2709 start_codon:yes stop_codon:yes gene_type:complete
MKKLFLIDGMALIYRSFYAFINNPLSTKEGFPTSAIFGFLNSISKILNEESPDYICIAMDSQKPTFRHEMYDLYKANRKKMPDDLRLQIPEINNIIEKSGINLLKKDGYEADDIIATIAKTLKNDDLKIYIVTGDKDIMQLVDDKTFVYSPGNKFSTPSVYDSNKVIDKWGVHPNEICDLLSIMGDGSDNIPGVKGVGPKTASKLIKQFGSVQKILDNISEISNLRIQNLIKDQKEMIELSNKLVELDSDVPIGIDIDKMSINEIDFSRISDDLIGFEMPNILNSLKVEIGDNVLDNSIDNFEKVASKYSLILTSENLSRLIEELSKQKIISFDLETTNLDPLKADIVGIALSFANNEAYYIPILFPDTIDEYDLSLDYVIKELRMIFENHDIGFVGQNIKYDCIILNRFGISVKNIFFDTMVAAHLINPIKNTYSINDLSIEYLNYRKINIESLIGDKANQINMSEVAVSKITDYACEDADIALQLYQRLSQELNDKSLIELFNKVELPFIKVLIELEINGLFVDIDMLKELSSKISMEIQGILKLVYENVGREFNVNSPKQLAEVLFDEIGLKEVRKRSTAVEVLEVLKQYHPLPETILRFRHLNKLKTTYLDGIPKFLNNTTGRVHSSFNQTVASTGRLSSTKPNFQNIPIRTDAGKEIRKAFKAQNNNWKLISADYSQIELRIMAHFSKEPALLEAFSNNEDVHKRTAALVYDLPIELVTSEQRRQAKIVNYGIMYGAGPFRMSQELGISMKNAKKIIDNYFNTYKSIKSYIDRNIDKAKEIGYVKTYFGRKRSTVNLNSSNANIVNAEKRAAVNMPIQGTAAELIKIAMIDISNTINSNNLKSRMVLQVHDELLFEIHPSEEKEMTNIIIDKMENSIDLDVPLKVDFKIGENWYDIH